MQESVQAGADLITASADKLIGASQGGIILGRADLIQAVRKNPLARIVRVGKLTLAALEATLSLFLDEATALREVPTLRMLRRGLAEISAQAERIAQAIGDRTSAAVVTTADGFSQMGSGSLPTQNLPTRLVAIRPESVEAGELALRLRRHAPPVFARVHKGQVLVDPRTLLDGEEQVLVEAVVQSVANVVGTRRVPTATLRRGLVIMTAHGCAYYITGDTALEQVNITLGTAGHIDHGKTALVKCLTGCDTDRLKEEKERGMSIELGFAPCKIADTQVGIVDVPGHENFIKTMVAGASGMDAVILVVAADDGVMPQTREHLDILTLLGVRHGIVALTKIDRVSPEHREAVRANVAAFLRGNVSGRRPDSSRSRT